MTSDTDVAPDDVGERAYRLHPKTSVPEMRLLDADTPSGGTEHCAGTAVR
jgi:hypothetical protein